MRSLLVASLVFLAVVTVIGACGGSAAPSASAPLSPTQLQPTATEIATPSAVTATASRPSASPPAAVRRHVVIDTDMAPDDWVAILYVLGRPDITVDAITVTGTGEAHCEPGVEHAGGLAALAGMPDIPVACGRETPLGSDHAFPDEWRAGVDALIGLDLPDGSSPATDESATELLTRIVEESAEPLTILTLGPLTNVAEALESDPSLAEAVAGIYAMGGAVEVEGNVGVSIGIDNQFAEWNIYADPHAAKIVLDSGAPIVLVPLDATNDVPISEPFAEELRETATTDSAEFVLDVLDVRMPFIRDGTYYFWDPFAAAVLVDESLATFETASLTVETEEGPDSGRVIPSEGGPQIRYAISGSRNEFEQELIDTLNGR